MTRYYFFFLAFFAMSFLRAQDCNCTHRFENLKTDGINIINASDFTYAAGDTFCIEAGDYAGLRFIGFEGEAANPLIFTNCGGLVTIREQIYSGIAFMNSKYIHLTGTGTLGVEYGLYVAEVVRSQMGVILSDLSSDIEVDHIEIANTGFAGIMAKTDPNCDKPETWRRNGYVFRNLSIHHNYIHDTHGEGMYIGYTGGYKVESKKICNTDTVFGHWLENVHISFLPDPV